MVFYGPACYSLQRYLLLLISSILNKGSNATGTAIGLRQVFSRGHARVLVILVSARLGLGRQFKCQRPVTFHKSRSDALPVVDAIERKQMEIVYPRYPVSGQ